MEDQGTGLDGSAEGVKEQAGMVPTEVFFNYDTTTIRS